MGDKTVSANTIVIERTFDAPVEVIWQMWADPEHFKHWYGPRVASVPVAEMDVRVGGKRLVCMDISTPDGSMKLWTAGEYKEVVPNERLVYTDRFSDEHGNPVSPSVYGMGDDELPPLTEVTVVLEDLGGRAKMTMTHVGVDAGSEGANEGWKQSFAKLEDYVETVINNA